MRRFDELMQRIRAPRIVWVQVFAVPEDVRSRWEVLDSADQFVAVALIESSSLKVIGEMDSLRAPARGRLGLGGRNEPSREAVTSKSRLHPEALQLA